MDVPKRNSWRSGCPIPKFAICYAASLNLEPSGTARPTTLIRNGFPLSASAASSRAYVRKGRYVDRTFRANGLRAYFGGSEVIEEWYAREDSNL